MKLSYYSPSYLYENSPPPNNFLREFIAGSGRKSMDSCSPCSMAIYAFRGSETDAPALVHCPTFLAKSYPFFLIYMSFIWKRSFTSCDQTWCFQRPPPGFDDVDEVKIKCTLYGLECLPTKDNRRYVIKFPDRDVSPHPSPNCKFPARAPSAMKMQNNFNFIFRHF